MTIALYILGGLATMILALNLVGLALPRSWQVFRAIPSSVPRAEVFPLIASFEHGWSHWSPWSAANDPTMTVVYEGPPVGVGATQAWTGGETGRGRITIVGADEARGVVYELAFGAFKIEGRIELEEGAIAWTNGGTLAGLPMFRLGRMFAERVVGKAMERGLANLVRRVTASTSMGGPDAGEDRPCL